MNATILPGDEVECIFPGPWLWGDRDGRLSYRDGPPLGSRWIVDATWLAGDDFTPHDMIALEGWPYVARWAAKRFKVIRLAHCSRCLRDATSAENCNHVHCPLKTKVAA
jgi:hypothetical protein